MLAKKQTLKSSLFLALVLNFCVLSHAQDMPPNGYPKQLRDTVLQYTDHFYVGMEIGLGFNISPTATLKPNDRMETNAAPFDISDFSMFTPTKFYAGYSFKNHMFEGSLGMMKDRVNVSIMDSTGNNRAVDFKSSKSYATMSVRYFYRFPMRIPRLKLIMGVELGGAFSPKFLQPVTKFDIYDSTYLASASMLKERNFMVIMGLSGRMDIKVCKNVTVILLATMLGSPFRTTEYALDYSYPGVLVNNAQVVGSMLNINLNAGIKIDFFSHKNKRKTYDKYNIEDPFRDK